MIQKTHLHIVSLFVICIFCKCFSDKLLGDCFERVYKENLDVVKRILNPDALMIIS